MNFLFNIELLDFKTTLCGYVITIANIGKIIKTIDLPEI